MKVLLHDIELARDGKQSSGWVLAHFLGQPNLPGPP